MKKYLSPEHAKAWFNENKTGFCPVQCGSYLGEFPTYSEVLSFFGKYKFATNIEAFHEARKNPAKIADLPLHFGCVVCAVEAPNGEWLQRSFCWDETHLAKIFFNLPANPKGFEEYEKDKWRLHLITD